MASSAVRMSECNAFHGRVIHRYESKSAYQVWLSLLLAVKEEMGSIFFRGDWVGQRNSVIGTTLADQTENHIFLAVCKGFRLAESHKGILSLILTGNDTSCPAYMGI